VLRLADIDSHKAMTRTKLFSSVLKLLKEMKNYLITLGVVSLLTACSAPPRYAYVKEGASAHTTRSALSKCEYQVRVNKTPAGEQNDLKHLCMEGEGFRYLQVN